MNTSSQKPRILIVDDEPAIRDLLSQMLDEEYECVLSGSAEDALIEFQRAEFDLVISDINLGGMTGVEMVPRLQELRPDTVVMMISGAGSMESAIEAMRVGVFDYVRKPFDFDQVIAAIKRAVDHHASLVEKRRHTIELSSLIEQRTAELHHISNYDTLTGLPNEALLHSRVDEIISGSARTKTGALMFVSLPNLRLVRSTFGHDVANRILVEAANRLRGVAPNGIVSKFEGNRFGIWIPDADSEVGLRITKSAMEILRPVFVAGQDEIHVHVNIGIGIYPADGSDYTRLAQSAGVALSRAEAEGPGIYRFYSAEMNAQALERLKLETNLRRALERGEFSLRYQPKLTVDSRKIVGMEALIRWSSPELGSVSPAIFIPIAEATDVIFPIGEWVLRTACQQTRVWHRMGFNVDVAVNLSGRQFENEDLAKCVWEILSESGMNPHFLNLEVTESSLVKSPDVAVAALTQLQKLGVNISIDDFGTGHSSLSYLRSLPVDVLKIDKSFVGNITTSTDAAILIQTIIKLGHDLRLRVVAEGVETEDQLRVLKELGCDEWQGFLHSAPLLPHEFETVLRAPSVSPEARR
jgi:diguanylate cyclase (GGDEF)-like protein